MFGSVERIEDLTKEDKTKGYKRYINALSASVRGTGSVFLKRNTKDVMTNNFNQKLMSVHKANHDIQIVVDQYACAQYVIGYLTKCESGMSQLLKAINEQAGNISNMEILDQLAAVLDKHREVSIQECVYRILSLPMTKSSIKVKYLSTIHPHYRDGLVKGNLDELPDGESIFHFSLHDYYSQRELECVDGIQYEKDEMEPNYWKNLSLAEFWSLYDTVYGSHVLHD